MFWIGEGHAGCRSAFGWGEWPRPSWKPSVYAVTVCCQLPADLLTSCHYMQSSDSGWLSFLPLGFGAPSDFMGRCIRPSFHMLRSRPTEYFYILWARIHLYKRCWNIQLYAPLKAIHFIDRNSGVSWQLKWDEDLWEVFAQAQLKQTSGVLLITSPTTGTPVHPDYPPSRKLAVELLEAVLPQM